jgi:hypothetical protein
MIGTTGAIIASAVIGGGLSLLSGKMQADAAEKGTKAVVDSNASSIRESKRQYDQNRRDLAPWRKQGLEALESIKTGMADGSFDMKNFEFKADPGYEFRMGEGTKALERSAAARGNLFSGATGRGLTEFAQNFASDEYDRAYARAAGEKRDAYNILAGQAGVGQMATQATVQAGNQNSANIIAANSNTGHAIARGAELGGGAWSGAMSNMGGALNTGIENYLLYNMVGG